MQALNDSFCEMGADQQKMIEEMSRVELADRLGLVKTGMTSQDVILPQAFLITKSK